MSKRLFGTLAVAALLFSVQFSSAEAQGARALREGGPNSNKTECISCSGKYDYAVGVCYRKHPHQIAGCNKAKQSAVARCIRTCTNNR